VNTLRAAVQLLVTALLCSGCVDLEPSPTRSSRTQPIVGGTPSTFDLTVFMLEIAGNNGANTRCSATLIAPRTLITAAHCVDPAMLGASQLTITASNAPTAAEMSAANTVRVVETRLHPRWNAAAGLGDDLALCLLEDAQGIAPSAWNKAALTGLGGEAVRLVGYGADAPDAGTGTRRTVDLIIRQLTPELISLGNFIDRGICHGDSGGPTFHTFPDGVERLVGVHSFTRTDDCLDGADTRVDAKAAFLLQWLSEKEENCGPNFVCAANACATVDPDCVALGSACEASWECPGRECITDPQHPAAYCSKPCSTDGDCSGGLRCESSRRVCQRPQLPSARPGEPCFPEETFCLSASVCNGREQAQARCSQPCERTLDCLQGLVCAPGFSGTNACLDPPPIVLPAGRVELPAARGCSATGSLGPALLLACWAGRRRMKNH
jgi:V8-like Glu-specific endopeptidase